MAGDSHFPSTSLLLHFDGADGSTSIVDSSARPKTVAAFGNAAISTAHGKFGGSCLSMSAGGGYLMLPASAEYEFAAADFTMEMWVKTTGFKGALINATYEENATWWDLSFYRGKLMWADYQSIGNLLEGDIPINDGSWHHIAVVRLANELSCYVDGVLDARSSFDPLSIPNFSEALDLVVGKYTIYDDTNYNFSGQIDDLRITKGVARYVNAFSAPTQAFANNIPADSVNAYCAAPTVLGAPSVFASPSVTQAAPLVQVWAEVPSPLAQPPATASVEYEPSSITTVRFGYASAALGMPPGNTSLQAKSLYAGVFGVASSSSALQAGPVASLSPAQISAVRMRVGLAASSMPSPVFGVVANHFRAQVESLATARFGGATTSHISFAESLMGARIGIPSLLLEGLSMGVSSLAPVQFGALGAWGAALRTRPLHCIKFGQPRLQRGTTC